MIAITPGIKKREPYPHNISIAINNLYRII